MAISGWEHAAAKYFDKEMTMTRKKAPDILSGITRRDFIKYTAGASMMLGMPGLLTGCGDSGGSSPGTRLLKTLYFDLSHGDQGFEYDLVTGGKRYLLKKTTPLTRQQARDVIPELGLVPDRCITHLGEGLPLSQDNLQTLYVTGRNPSGAGRLWTLPLIFCHIPDSALQYAFQTMKELYPDLAGAPSTKFGLYGLHVLRDTEEGYLRQHSFKNGTSQAVQMLFHHPEMLCFNANSGAHIQQNIIGPQETTQRLAQSVQNQGAATESGGWATLVPLIDPDTGKPYPNSKGENTCVVKWSDETNDAAGHAVFGPLTIAKNDLTLGANITNLDPETDNPELEGKIWVVEDGQATVNAADVSYPESDYEYTFPHKGKSHGYDAKLNSVDAGRKVTIEVRNWYMRYLGLYIRFLDSGGKPIPISTLPSSTTDDFPDDMKRFDGKYDKCAAFVKSDFSLCGIPFKHSTTTFTFHMPELAASALVLSGGTGSGSNPYPDTVDLGDAPTVLLNLGVPGLFLLWDSPTGYIDLIAGGISKLQIIQLTVDLIIAGILDFTTMGVYGDKEALINMAQKLGLYILGKAGKWFKKLIWKSEAEGEAEDSIPILGSIFAVLGAAACVAQMSEVISYMVNCPQTYKDKLTFTHSITVTVLPDKNHKGIFPETATHYELTALFDDGTPVYSGSINMPVPSPEQIVFQFKGVPYGGHVNISVGFYSDTDWLAGKGSTGTILNTVDHVEFLITEFKVPITVATQYHHLQKTALDKDGHLIWKASAAPTATRADLSCESHEGQLCLLTGITVSQYFEALGYSWQSFTPNMPGCESGGTGQFYQFATMAITTDPQKGYGGSTCGFSSPVHVVYDLMGKANDNFYLDNTNDQRLIRQIRLNYDAPPDIDGPESNRAWGKFNNPVDALLLHPSGYLVSISVEFDKIEVLELPDEAVPDEDALLAQAYSGTGTREGLVKGPVAAAIAPRGAIYILEAGNQRIQAFDLGINPIPNFKASAYYVPLKEETEAVSYLAMSVEFTGYIYVLSCTENDVYRLDIYSPEGEFLSRTIGVNTARLTVDFWRNVYGLNYEYLTLPGGDLPGFTEPSVSLWIPSTPPGFI